MCLLLGGSFEECCMSQHNLSFYKTKVEDPSLGREFIPHSLETSLLWQSFLTRAAEQMSHWGFDRSSSSWAPPSPPAPQRVFWIPTSFLQPLPIAFCTLKAFCIVCSLLLYFLSPSLLCSIDMFLKIRVMSHSCLYHSTTMLGTNVFSIFSLWQINAVSFESCCISCVCFSKFQAVIVGFMAELKLALQATLVHVLGRSDRKKMM